MDCKLKRNTICSGDVLNRAVDDTRLIPSCEGHFIEYTQMAWLYEHGADTKILGDLTAAQRMVLISKIKKERGL